jgi:hypothetical protein
MTNKTTLAPAIEERGNASRECIRAPHGKVAEKVYRSNKISTRVRWGNLPKSTLQALKELTTEHRLSVQSGDLLLLDGHWYVTHTGLLRLARRSRCAGISVEAVPALSDAAAGRWAFKATVFKTAKCKGFVGYGDADPSNVSPVVRGAEMRVAETRAVNRALRKAYGIGLCSVEEIGATSQRVELASQEPPKHSPKFASNGSGTNSTVRDRLTLLIRQHQLDPALVKLYAADFCGVHELRSASRELVEDFVNELAIQAAKDRNSLLCKLNAYAPKQEGAA